ncbi:MAG: hypothetical protein JXB32_25205 [Deltaproteobacteria bacterium]|nr:hypothetical protein [Deltaproteobacteria bacterium]
MKRDRRRWAAAAAAVLALAAVGCRCGSSTPGTPGKAGSALEAIPGDVDAVIVINAEGLRQGSLGELVYHPFIVRQLAEWGGSACATLAQSTTRSAAIGVRLTGGQEVFFAAEGPTLEEVKRCVDEHAKRQGLSSSYEAVEGVRGLTDSRGMHVLAAGEQVIARSFPFANLTVLAEAARVAQGSVPNLAGNAAFRDLVADLGGDVTVALSDAAQLLGTYGAGLEEAVAGKVPPDLCATPFEIQVFLTTARALGFGELHGIEAVVKAKFAGRDSICVRDVVQETFRTLVQVRSAGVTLTGRTDVELGLVLVFADDAAAAEVRGVLGDIVHALSVLPAKLDTLERDWPMLVASIQKQVDIPTLRNVLRNPVFEQLTVSGEGPKVELRLRVEESDVRAAVESTQRLITRLVAPG